MSSKLPPIPPTSPHVRYVRNFDQVMSQMKTEDLMTDTLSNNFLYSTINVGEQAAHFFTDTVLGADFDRRLRERFLKGFEALLSAPATDAAAVSEAQQACLVVLGIYDTVAAQMQDRLSALQELKTRDAYQEDDTDQGE